MRKSKYQQLLLVLILIGGALILSGCSGGMCDKGPQQLSAKWIEKKLPTVEGAEVCFCDEKHVLFVHHNAEYFELVNQYADKFKKDGWAVSPVERGSNGITRFMVSKDKDDNFRNNFISLSFQDCLFRSLRDRMSKCSQVEVFDPSVK